MAFTERAKTAPPVPKRHGPECSVGALLRSLPAAEAKALHAMLYETWPGSSRWRRSKEDLLAEIMDEGHHVGKTSINHHRSGNCGCPRDAA